MNKKSALWQIIKQLFLLIWKLFLMLTLIAGRIITMVVTIMNTKIEDYLNVPKKNL
jgi:hypothetical protein